MKKHQSGQIYNKKRKKQLFFYVLLRLFTFFIFCCNTLTLASLPVLAIAFLTNIAHTCGWLPSQPCCDQARVVHPAPQAPVEISLECFEMIDHLGMQERHPE